MRDGSWWIKLTFSEIVLKCVTQSFPKGTKSQLLSEATCSFTVCFTGFPPFHVSFPHCLKALLEKEMETHSSALAWRILWTEEPAGLPSMGSHRVGHD